MLKRVFIIWIIPNFLVIGIVSWIAGDWYLGWKPFPGMLSELGLIMLPNLVLPILLLKFWWPGSVVSIRDAPGWNWNGWRAVIVVILTFLYPMVFLT